MSYITVHLRSALTSSERKISPEWTLEHLQNKIEQITGIPPSRQKISVSSASGSQVVELDTSVPFISQTVIKDQCRVEVEDTEPETFDVDLEEYKIDEAKYAQREDSVLKWKERARLGRFDPEYERKQKKQDDINADKAKGIKVGNRCRIVSEAGERRGVVKYVGKIAEIPGDTVWVGVELDEPLGKNDGSVKGVRYFEGRDKFGLFVKPMSVEVGDFPCFDEELFDGMDEL